LLQKTKKGEREKDVTASSAVIMVLVKFQGPYRRNQRRENRESLFSKPLGANSDDFYGRCQETEFQRNAKQLRR